MKHKSATTDAMPMGNEKSAYANSFGPIPDKFIYHGGIKRDNPYGDQKDFRPQIHEKAKEGVNRALKKAFETTTGGAGTAGYAMIPVYVDPRIVDVSRKFTPLVELIPRVTNQGITADYNRVESKGSATTYQEDAAFTEANHTRDRLSKSIKYLASVGRVTGQAQAAVPSYIMEGFMPSGSGLGAGNPFSNVNAGDAMQQEVLLAARALKEFEEDLIINGNATTSAVGTGPNGTEYDGIIIQQGTTNQTDKSGAVLEWDDVEKAVEDAYVDSGRPNLAICSPRVMRRLRQIMVSTFRFNPNSITTEIAFGIPAGLILHTQVGPVPVIMSQFLSNTAAAGRIYFLDMDYVEMRVLLDMTFERLAKNNDSDKFFLKIYEVLLLRAPEFNSCIIGIA